LYEPAAASHRVGYEAHSHALGVDASEEGVIAAQLLAQGLTALRAEVALDEQGERPLPDLDPGDGVGTQEAAEQPPAGAFRDPDGQPLRNVWGGGAKNAESRSWVASWWPGTDGRRSGPRSGGPSGQASRSRSRRAARVSP
jgi:hypothetical protein